MMENLVWSEKSFTANVVFIIYGVRNALRCVVVAFHLSKWACRQKRRPSPTNDTSRCLSNHNAMLTINNRYQTNECVLNTNVVARRMKQLSRSSDCMKPSLSEKASQGADYISERAPCLGPDIPTHFGVDSDFHEVKSKHK